MRRGGLAALICLIGLAVSAPGAAVAADICNAVALMDVPDWGDGYPQDASGQVLKKGETDDAVTQYRVNKKTGDAVFCSHGGDCYPRFLTVGGQKVEALHLTNCKIGAREPDMPGITNDDIFYDVDVDRSKNSAADLREDDIDNALLNLGMCSACAGNAAYIYVRSPQSACGAAVANALAGDKRAIAQLVGDDYDNLCPYPQVDASGNVIATNAADLPASAPAVNVASPPENPAPSRPVSPLEVAIGIAALLYFLPSLIGFLRRKRNAGAIFALNLFLGWTFLGWVGALVWSLLSDPRAPVAAANSPPPPIG